MSSITINECMIQVSEPKKTRIPCIMLPTDKFWCEPLTIASLTLNTAILKNTCIKLDFVTNYHVFGLTAGTMKFQVYKQCDNQIEAIPIGPSYLYGPLACGNRPISFFISDFDNSCFPENSCCTYTVRVSAAHLMVLKIGCGSFRNSVLAATVSSNGSCICS